MRQEQQTIPAPPQFQIDAVGANPTQPMYQTNYPNLKQRYSDISFDEDWCDFCGQYLPKHQLHSVSSEVKGKFKFKCNTCYEEQ